MEHLPTRDDINPSGKDALDEVVAVRRFLGKSQEDAVDLFASNVVAYSESLMWMGGGAFRYYYTSFSKYLESSMACGNADAVNALISIVRGRCNLDPESIFEEKPLIEKDIGYCISEFEKFDVDEKIYGNLRGSLILLLKNIQDWEDLSEEPLSE